MGSSNIFVGRHDELDQFKQVLERPDGEAVVVKKVLVSFVFCLTLLGLWV